jgi:mono/diheme cytochrome c family protein
VKTQIALAALLGIALAGCKKEYRFDPPEEADRVSEAAARITPQLFDSIAWSDQATRLQDGNEVFAAHCRRCHGTLGEGGTAYSRERNLDVPSLVDPGWHWADSLEVVRRTVFTGHMGGMPTWGIAGITPREIDAASYYVLFELRPDAVSKELGG